MRDYSNLPILKWQGTASTRKAIAQVHHAEPVIIQFAEGFNMAIDASNYSCKAGKTSGQHLDCNASDTLAALAEINQLPELVELAEAAHTAGQVVDIETDKRRIIIHD